MNRIVVSPLCFAPEHPDDLERLNLGLYLDVERGPAKSTRLKIFVAEFRATLGMGDALGSNSVPGPPALAELTVA
jgi:hypothetical protein